MIRLRGSHFKLCNGDVHWRKDLLPFHIFQKSACSGDVARAFHILDEIRRILPEIPSDFSGNYIGSLGFEHLRARKNAPYATRAPPLKDFGTSNPQIWGGRIMVQITVRVTVINLIIKIFLTRTGSVRIKVYHIFQGAAEGGGNA